MKLIIPLSWCGYTFSNAPHDMAILSPFDIMYVLATKLSRKPEQIGQNNILCVVRVSNFQSFLSLPTTFYHHTVLWNV